MNTKDREALIALAMENEPDDVKERHRSVRRYYAMVRAASKLDRTLTIEEKGVLDELFWPPEPPSTVDHDDLYADEPYDKLLDVLSDAYHQSANGKGRARHANDRPFDRQPILEIARMVGPGFGLGQAMKKAQEASGMIGRDELAAARAELLGAIVYLSSVVVLIDERADQTPTSGELGGSDKSL